MVNADEWEDVAGKPWPLVCGLADTTNGCECGVDAVTNGCCDWEAVTTNAWVAADDTTDD